MPEDKSRAEFDMFVAYAKYPDAGSLFGVMLRSLQEIKSTAAIVLDTNALLVPYGISRDSLQQIKETYEKLVAAGQLIIPGQVAREFVDNRAGKLGELFQQLTRKRNSVQALQKGSYPLLEALGEYQEAMQLEREIDSLLGKYRDLLGKVLDYVGNWTWNDPVSVLYSEIFSNVVSDIPINRDDIRADLEHRHLHHIPPGYKDSTKEDGGIGDLLIWHTILEVGRSQKRDVIFVSSDQKTDWWHRSEKEALYPRYELVDEFRRTSDGRSFHIVTFSRFLDLYGASTDTVQEVHQEERKLSESDLTSTFMQKWQSLEQALFSKHAALHPEAVQESMSTGDTTQMLYREGAISGDIAAVARELNRFRNAVIHGKKGFSVEEFQERMHWLDVLLEEVAAIEIPKVPPQIS